MGVDVENLEISTYEEILKIKLVCLDETTSQEAYDKFEESITSSGTIELGSTTSTVIFTKTIMISVEGETIIYDEQCESTVEVTTTVTETTETETISKRKKRDIVDDAIAEAETFCQSLLEGEEPSIDDLPTASIGCFSEDTTVQTRAGLKMMSELELGDEIQTMPGKYQTVDYWIHRDTAEKMVFHEIQTVSGHKLSMSSYHMLPLFDNCDMANAELSQGDQESLVKHASRFAQRAQPGMCILRLSDDGQSLHAEPIQSVSPVAKVGVFAPLTAMGDILVDGIYTSCYSHGLESHVVQHSIYSVLLNANRFFGDLLASFHSEIPYSLHFVRFAYDAIVSGF
jgi:hypothetical protein